MTELFDKLSRADKLRISSAIAANLFIAYSGAVRPKNRTVSIGVGRLHVSFFEAHAMIYHGDAKESISYAALLRLAARLLGEVAA